MTSTREQKRETTGGERLAGEVAIVTGAAHGIGRAIAHRFAAEGAAVMLVDRDEEGGQASCTAIQEGGGSAAWVVCAVAEDDAVADAVRRTAERYGPVTVLVNNAGIMPEGTVETTSLETWHRVLETNLTSMFLFARAVVPQMVAAGGGSIVNIASVQGLRGHPQRIAYVTSKHGVIGITRALAADHAAAKVRVNAICPGTIDTPMLHRELAKVPVEERDALLAEYRELHPLREIGRPEDVAAAALFLASDEAAFITGAALPVDGGYTSLIVHL